MHIYVTGHQWVNTAYCRTYNYVKPYIDINLSALSNDEQSIKTISYASLRTIREHNRPIDAFVWYAFIPRLHKQCPTIFNANGPEQNERHFVDGIFKFIIQKENSMCNSNGIATNFIHITLVQNSSAFTGLGNGLSPSIRQSSVCSNCDTDHWHLYHQASSVNLILLKILYVIEVACGRNICWHVQYYGVIDSLESEFEPKFFSKLQTLAHTHPVKWFPETIADEILLYSNYRYLEASAGITYILVFQEWFSAKL